METKRRAAPEPSVGADEERTLKSHEESISHVDEKVNKNSIPESENIATVGTEVELTEVKWLWPPYIPLGKVTLLAGDPGVGKSRFALDLAARVTTGSPFPFSTTEREAENVLVVTNEDDMSDTVLPRFVTAGGDLSKLFFTDELKHGKVRFDDSRLRSTVIFNKVRLLIIDPLSSYIGKIDLNAANQVRPQFDYLISLAKETGCAVLIVAHLNKASEKKLIHRTTGSIDIVAAARSELALISDPECPEKKFLLHAKANLSAPGSCIELKTREDGTLEFLREIDRPADQLFNDLNPVGRHPDRLKQAMDILEKFLADGPKTANECQARLSEFSNGTMQSAKAALGVSSRKIGKTWWWFVKNCDAK